MNDLIDCSFIRILMNESNVNWFQFSLRRYCRFIVINKLLELVLVCVMKFSKAEKPFINVDWVLIANGSCLQKIICVLFCFGLRNVFLNVLVKPDCFVQVDGFQIIKIDIVEDFLKFFLIVFVQFVECFLFWNQSTTEKSTLQPSYILASSVFSPGL